MSRDQRTCKEAWEHTVEKLQDLSSYLHKQSKRICQENGCTEDEHKCECYAYIDGNFDLLDVCIPDFFAGTSKLYASVPLPWTGTWSELKEIVENEIAESILE